MSKKDERQNKQCHTVDEWQAWRLEGQTEEAQDIILSFLEVRLGTVPLELTSHVKQITDINRLRSLRKMLYSGIPLAEFEQALVADC